MKFLLLLLLFFSNVFAQEPRRIYLANGVELEITGQLSQPDPVFGLRSKPGSSSEVKKFHNGKQVSQWKATIGSNGLRVSLPEGAKTREKHLLIFGSSSVFGEDLDDHETISYQVNERLKDYEAYPVAFLGYGLQHAWVTLKNGELKDKIKQEKGKAVLLMGSHEVRRFFCTLEHLTYCATHPRVIEREEGQFEHTGNFVNSGGLFQQLIAKFCIPSNLCRDLLPHKHVTPTTEQLNAVGRLFNSMEAIYKEQFQGESFKVIWIGAKVPTELLRTSKVPIYPLPPDLKQSKGHPDGSDIKRIVDYLFENKVIE